MPVLSTSIAGMLWHDDPCCLHQCWCPPVLDALDLPVLDYWSTMQCCWPASAAHTTLIGCPTSVGQLSQWWQASEGSALPCMGELARACCLYAPACFLTSAGRCSLSGVEVPSVVAICTITLKENQAGLATCPTDHLKL